MKVNYRDQEDRNLLSKTVYWMRTIGLISIISAHATYSWSDYDFLNRLCTSFSNAGVAIFFCVSGLYWRKKPVKDVLIKICEIFPIWFIGGGLIYLISIRPSLPSITGYVLWIVGYNTYLWYLTIYCLILLMFNVFNINSRCKSIVCIVLMILSRCLTAVLNLSGPIAFLNIMNWAGFFAIGVVCKDYTTVIWRQKKFLLLIGVVGLVCFLFIDMMLDSGYTYWTVGTLFQQISWILISFLVSRVFYNFPGYEIGKESLPIYVLHIPIIGFFSNRISIGFEGVIILATVIAIVMFLVIRIGLSISKKMRCDKIYRALFALK